jgi:diguanylate cyclase (GGDEF)-like protein
VGNALRFIGVLAIFVASVSGVVWISSARERELATREFAELNAAHAMVSSAVSREGALRGYAQTSRRSFLESYDETSASLADAIGIARSYAVEGGVEERKAIRDQERLAARWAALASEAIDRIGTGRPITLESTAIRSDLIQRLRGGNDELVEAISRESDRAHAASVRRSVLLIALLSGAFAAAAGILMTRLRRRERDRQAAEQRYHASQREFTETLQVTQSESEAHVLVKRHLERCVPRSRIVVLNRNNSQNRLEAATPVEDSCSLAEKLMDSQPSSCLAVRLSKTHSQSRADEPLLACELCATHERTTCVPSLVGGEVIGSVLVTHELPLSPSQRDRIDESVGQAAPVLANLRNLALAEIRAATDALTGLPNSRALRDNLVRMVAQASRSAGPLSAILCDLDHFKQINDVYGHDKGDQALAAASAALRSSIRESDLAGRYGGEEFLILLPDTALEGAVDVAEKLRSEVSRIAVPGVDRPITASFGIASFPQDAPDGEMLVRIADRALYAAKARGRNCVVSSAELMPDLVV